MSRYSYSEEEEEAEYSPDEEFVFSISRLA